MKILQTSLVLVLALSALLQLLLGAWLLTDLPGAAAAFRFEYHSLDALDYIATFFALTLLAMAVLSGLTAWWVARHEPFGLYLAYYHGVILTGAGLAGSLLTGRPDAVGIDLLRGVLILILAIAYGRRKARVDTTGSPSAFPEKTLPGAAH